MIDNYKLYIINNSEVYDATQIAGGLSWKDNIDSLGMKLTFSKGNSDEKYFPKFNIDVGQKIILKNNDKEVFKGIIVQKDINGIFDRSYTCYDYAFYLNKSKTLIQFNNTKVSDAIKQLCNKFNVPIGNIVDISTLVTKIYSDKNISDIIKDLLQIATDELGIKYRMEMREGKFYIEKYEDLVVKAYYKPASNLSEFDVTNAIGSGVSRSRSIVDMKNSIIVTSGNEENIRTIAKTEDENNIKEYGLLQDTYNVDDKNIAQARNIAKNKLNELNKIIEDNSIELLGNDDVRAGRILELNETVTGTVGKYLVKDCTHTYNNHTHKMQLQLGVA